MSNKQALRAVLAILGLITAFSCKEASMKNAQSGYARLDEISAKKWEALSQKRIFFGHKSVGVNIIDGIRDIIARRPAVSLNIVESSSASDFGSPVFAHALIGTNKEPSSKINRFLEIMEGGVGRVVDIAFFKFCFVDVDHATDVDALFKHYADTVARLETEFPDVKIVTMTVPLTSKPVGIKARLKKILGRLPWDEVDNIKRNEINNMLRDRFKGSLFDLAAVESRIDGTRKATFEKDGKEYELLYRPYTSDGGHLNSAGRQIVALELLRYLATLEDR